MFFQEHIKSLDNFGYFISKRENPINRTLILFYDESFLCYLVLNSSESGDLQKVIGIVVGNFKLGFANKLLPTGKCVSKVKVEQLTPCEDYLSFNVWKKVNIVLLNKNILRKG